jgi:hypothetical protein
MNVFALSLVTIATFATGACRQGPPATPPSVAAPVTAATRATAAAADPLPSWNDSAVKKSLVDFVDRTTKQGAPDFVPPSERIAVFDNDGTLWAEQPMYTQLAFALDRIKALAPNHPEWKTAQPFKGVIEGDIKAPTIAFGNSDGDFEMLEWTTSAAGPRLGVIVHHTDADREWAYDRESYVGQLMRGLDEGPKRGWLIVDMKTDWKSIYPIQK